MSVISDLPSRLIRFDVDSIESSIRPFRFSFARSSSPLRARSRRRRRASSLGDDLEALDEVLLARADVEADLAGVGVLGGEAVDRVRHPALLADLLEEPRGRRAAEDRVEQRGGEAAARREREMPGSAEADVVLLGVLALEAVARGRRARERLAARARAASRVFGEPRAASSSTQPLVLDVAGGRDDDVVVRVDARGGRSRARARETDEITSAPPDHRPAERMAAEDRLRDEVVDEVLRVVVDHRDLLEHDLPLGVELGERRVVDHADDHVERRLEPVVGHAGVDERRLARGGRVQLAARARRRSPRSPARCASRVPLKSRCSMKCETPARASVSSREPVPIQKPSETERTLGDVLGDHPLAGGERREVVALHRPILASDSA